MYPIWEYDKQLKKWQMKLNQKFKYVAVWALNPQINYQVRYLYRDNYIKNQLWYHKQHEYLRGWTRQASSWAFPQSFCLCSAHLVFLPHTGWQSPLPAPHGPPLPSPSSAAESLPSLCTPWRNRSCTGCVSASSGHTQDMARCWSEREREKQWVQQCF